MKKNPIPPEVKEFYDYDPETGAITHKKPGKRHGKPAGTWRKDRGGLLLQPRIKGKQLRFQGARVIWYLHTGEDPGDLCVDHINGDRNDNRFQNLRLCTHQENTFNRRGVKGYSWNHGRWRVEIRMFGKTLVSGRFKTEEEASAFYKENIKRLRNEFAPT